VRSDSAAYEQENLDHGEDRGWKFAVSTDMSPQLKQEIEAWYENGLRCVMLVRSWYALLDKTVPFLGV
jgi:hypothetical protein